MSHHPRPPSEVMAKLSRQRTRSPAVLANSRFYRDGDEGPGMQSGCDEAPPINPKKLVSSSARAFCKSVLLSPSLPFWIHASRILSEYGEAQSKLIGKAVVLTDGKAGTVENVWLDELHGLRISIKGHDGRWPVSTIKFREN